MFDIKLYESTLMHRLIFFYKFWPTSAIFFFYFQFYAQFHNLMKRSNDKYHENSIGVMLGPYCCHQDANSQPSGQSYKHFMIIICDPRVVIWSIF